MRAVLPLIYLAAGWALARMGIDFRRGMSRALSLAIIPVVIVFHVASGTVELAGLMLCAFAWMLALFVAGRCLSRDPIDTLCFCYLNIGWLGLPVASATLGPPAIGLFTAFYVASSILGNGLGPAWLRRHGPENTPAGWLGHAWRTPALRALLLGLCLLPFGSWLTTHAAWLNDAARLLLGLMGMMVLGAWLAQAPVGVPELLRTLRWFGWRAAVSLPALALLWALTSRLGDSPLRGQFQGLVLLSLLPPAANIVVLETEALKTGASASRIAGASIWSLCAIAIFVAWIHLAA